ncbi:MAG: ParB N-terminal domain-containing protein [Pseudomonadota bacterium]
MAKRKRLTPPDPAWLDPPMPPLETKALTFGTVQPARQGATSTKTPPIADVARDAAREAALTEVAGELAAAREEGRLVQTIPLEAIAIDYLVRDRMGVDDDEMAALKASIRERGQQTPIDVITLEPGRYGLISGWRRLAAIRALQAETGEARFATIKALNRTPETSSDAYLAMVEENEIRVGLSFYERARIALKAAEQGAYPNPKKAVLELYRSSSRPKRSKIHSFLTVVEALDGALRFPTAIPERLGLRLAKLFDSDPPAGDLIRRAVAARASETAEDETMFLDSVLKDRTAALRRPLGGVPGSASKEPMEYATALGLTVKRHRNRIVITGSLVSHDLAESLSAWLKDTLK